VEEGEEMCLMFFLRGGGGGGGGGEMQNFSLSSRGICYRRKYVQLNQRLWLHV